MFSKAFRSHTKAEPKRAQGPAGVSKDLARLPESVPGLLGRPGAFNHGLDNDWIYPDSVL